MIKKTFLTSKENKVIASEDLLVYPLLGKKFKIKKIRKSYERPLWRDTTSNMFIFYIETFIFFAYALYLDTLAAFAGFIAGIGLSYLLCKRIFNKFTKIEGVIKNSKNVKESDNNKIILFEEAVSGKTAQVLKPSLLF